QLVSDLGGTAGNIMHTIVTHRGSSSCKPPGRFCFATDTSASQRHCYSILVRAYNEARSSTTIQAYNRTHVSQRSPARGNGDAGLSSSACRSWHRIASTRAAHGSRWSGHVSGGRTTQNSVPFGKTPGCVGKHTCAPPS